MTAHGLTSHIYESWRRFAWSPSVENHPPLMTLAKPFLFVASVLLRLGADLRNFLFEIGLMKSRKLAGITISVGNVVVGGTGKSIVVSAICRHLINAGFHPAIVSRGYRSGMKHYDSLVLLEGNLIQFPAATTFESRRFSLPDEPMMLSRQLPQVPVVVGASRWSAVTRFCRENSAQANLITHWILDDGFQHRSLQRDVDLVLMDFELGIGNGKLLPLGPLRESVDSLKRATCLAFVHRSPAGNSADPAPPATSRKESESFSYRGPTFHLQISAGVPIQRTGALTASNSINCWIAMAGIAHPEFFLYALKERRLIVGTKIILPDHARVDAKWLMKKCKNHQALITTDKDYFRDPVIFENLPIPTFTLPVDVNLPPEFIRQLGI